MNSLSTTHLQHCNNMMSSSTTPARRDSSKSPIKAARRSVRSIKHSPPRLPPSSRLQSRTTTLPWTIFQDDQDKNHMPRTISFDSIREWINATTDDEDEFPFVLVTPKDVKAMPLLMSFASSPPNEDNEDVVHDLSGRFSLSVGLTEPVVRARTPTTSAFRLQKRTTTRNPFATSNTTGPAPVPPSSTIQSSSPESIVMTPSQEPMGELGAPPACRSDDKTVIVCGKMPSKLLFPEL